MWYSHNLDRGIERKSKLLMNMEVNAQYNVARPGSVPTRIAEHQRRKMYQKFLQFTSVTEAHTILDIGVTSDQTYTHSNYLEAWYPYKSKITAVGIDDASFLEQRYPGVKFVQADGRALPFDDNSFDFVHSSAVLEHVGSRANQLRFLRESLRVARKGIFITTPNRWFPIEFHTLLPLAHWLPADTFRRIASMTGRSFFSSEENLNLLAQKDLQLMMRETGYQSNRIDFVSLLGWPTNLLLVVNLAG